MLRLAALSAVCVVAFPAAAGAGVGFAIMAAAVVFSLSGWIAGELTGPQALELLGECLRIAAEGWL